MELNVSREYPVKKINVENIITGFYSTDELGCYQHNLKKLLYLKWDRLKFLLNTRGNKLDLAKGHETYMERTQENHDSFYRYLCDHREVVANFSASSLSNAGFICNKIGMRNISRLPYTNDEQLFVAYLYQGSIHLHSCNPQSNTAVDKDSSEVYRSVRNKYLSTNNISNRMGHKFEQYILSDHPDSEPVTNVPVKEAEDFVLVNNMILNNHRILHSAEVDGVIIEECGNQTPVKDFENDSVDDILKDLRTRKFLELKTCTRDYGHVIFMKFKTIDMWSQMFFSGTETAVVGIRTYDGILCDLKKFDLSDIVKIGERYWNPDVCINFCDTFLTFVKKCFEREISKLTDRDSVDFKNLPPIELFFERKRESPVVVCENPVKSEQYLYPWIIEGISLRGLVH